MKSFFALALPALALAAPVPQEDEMSVQIVGGVPAVAGDAPFIVAISRSGNAHCGGSLIDSTTVVTAAHCTQPYAVNTLTIRAGSLQRTSGGVTSNVASKRVHPNYNANTYENDIAVIKLSTPIPESDTIKYAKLAASGSDPAAGTTLTVAGWGSTRSGGSATTELRKVDVPVVARATCDSNYQPEGLSVTSDMFCAAPSGGGKDSCQGDSGGPIFDSSKTLVGTVSWGIGCAQAGYPGVYARVGAQIPFITGS
ncbi:unnamed protein product [Periconia digitata]|uniref:Peptidase S1 domain-containing protein n=1 Tax=Periconia digitata TaxID=1303443 RepID=A0A9W4UUE5_9PLEO|nr:unnamed protein product [Periconia digitata]